MCTVMGFVRVRMRSEPEGDCILGERPRVTVRVAGTG